MSEQELAVIKERADKATVGPWFYEGERVSSENGRGVFSILNEQYIYGNDYDLRFIEHAREDIPKLVAEVERLQSQEHFAEYAIRQNKALWEALSKACASLGADTLDYYEEEGGV